MSRRGRGPGPIGRCQVHKDSGLLKVAEADPMGVQVGVSNMSRSLKAFRTLRGLEGVCRGLCQVGGQGNRPKHTWEDQSG